jgi:RNA polymerase-binding protein DksA
MAAKKTSPSEAEQNVVPSAETTAAPEATAQPPAKKTAAKKAPAKRADTTKRTATTKAPATKAPAKKAPAKKAPAGNAPAGKAATKQTAAKRTSTAKLAVRPGEKPWTPKQVDEVRATLQSDAERLQVEIVAAEEEISQLLRQGGEGAGHDQADVGSNTFERDQEMTMAQNARENLALVQAALTRIDEGHYGVCESCGQPIGKMRLQAFPRATLCMECKQREERR